MVQRRAAELVQRDKGEDVVDNDVVHDKERELLLVLPKKMVSMSNSIGAVMLQRVVLRLHTQLHGLGRPPPARG